MDDTKRRSASKVATAALIVAFVVFVVALSWLAITAPPTIPSHFSGDGSVDQYGSKSVVVLILGIIGVALLALFGGARWYLPKTSGQFINVPNRGYWTMPENRDQFDAKVITDLAWMGAATMLLLASLAVTMGAAAGGASTGALTFIIPIGLYVAVMIAYALWMAAGPRYRIPIDASL